MWSAQGNLNGNNDHYYGIDRTSALQSLDLGNPCSPCLTCPRKLRWFNELFRHLYPHVSTHEHTPTRTRIHVHVHAHSHCHIKVHACTTQTRPLGTWNRDDVSVGIKGQLLPLCILSMSTRQVRACIYKLNCNIVTRERNFYSKRIISLGMIILLDHIQVNLFILADNIVRGLNVHTIMWSAWV